MTGTVETKGLIKPEEVEKMNDKEYRELIKELRTEIRIIAIEQLTKTIIKKADDKSIEEITYLKNPKDGWERYMDTLCEDCRFERCCDEGYHPKPCDDMFKDWKIEINIKLIPPPSPSPQRCKDDQDNT